jgi:hypothetical protein
VTSPAATELQRLRRLGFRPDPILGADGLVEVVYFMREWQGWREVVLVYSEIEARAYRIRAAAAAANPLYVDSDAVDVMIPLDDVVTVVHALLSLPAPPPRSAA